MSTRPFQNFRIFKQMHLKTYHISNSLFCQSNKKSLCSVYLYLNRNFKTVIFYQFKWIMGRTKNKENKKNTISPIFILLNLTCRSVNYFENDLFWWRILFRIFCLKLFLENFIWKKYSENFFKILSRNFSDEFSHVRLF